MNLPYLEAMKITFDNLQEVADEAVVDLPDDEVPLAPTKDAMKCKFDPAPLCERVVPESMPPPPPRSSGGMRGMSTTI